MKTVLEVTQGKFELRRLPATKNKTLRAWDAADEYLLNYLSEQFHTTETQELLILNDSFGALAVALHSSNPTAISDSWLSQQATRLNLQINNIAPHKVTLKNTLDWPIQTFNLVLIKVPKTLALLEDQLIRLQNLLTEKTTIIAAGMVKTMPSKVWQLMEKYLGETVPSLAQKKARLIFTRLDNNRPKVANPYPVYYQLENTDYVLCNHANVFSRASLDIGTRFLLKHLPINDKYNSIVDLGCGNGVVGLMLAQNHPRAELYFVDESFMAVASAKENFHHAFSGRKAQFSIADGMPDFKTESMDLIVCNPPFHQHNVIGNQIAYSLFGQAHRVLRQEGQFWVIGNRHLGYHITLKKLFRHAKEIAANSKFIIWQMIK